MSKTYVMFLIQKLKHEIANSWDVAEQEAVSLQSEWGSKNLIIMI